jgi:signal transduction histidine kinase
MPWGTHFCHFYESKDDLVDILIPYFRAGLESNELCIWILFDPIADEEAVRMLREGVPGADQFLEAGAIEIIPHSQWYLREGTFDLNQAIGGLQEKLTEALDKGYAGLRVNGNEAWLTEQDWNAFSDYEHKLNRMIVDRRMIVLCTYPLGVTTARELFAVARTHQFAIAKNNGAWEVFETPDLRQAKEELRRLNADLERRVEERTLDLALANDGLKAEISARQVLETKLRESERQYRALSGRVQAAKEEEGARIAREIHDELGSALASLKWELEGLDKEFAAWDDQPEEEALRRKVHLMLKLTDALIDSVRRIASELRPSILDDLGIVEAIEWQGQQFQERTGIVCRFSPPQGKVSLNPDQATAAFRIFQEALTNILRHAGATQVCVAIKQRARAFVLIVGDNGKGFVAEYRYGQNSLGLLGMRERARLAGGRIWLRGKEGAGTTILLRIPSGGSER